MTNIRPDPVMTPVLPVVADNARVFETNVVVDAIDTRRQVKPILAGSVGNLIERYDLYAYAGYAPVFTHGAARLIALI